MPRRPSPRTYARARQLRNEPTEAEVRLWAYLRRAQLHGVRFRRQHPIGPYIADFCAVKQRLIIEVDGSGHLQQHEQDAQRTRYLASQGYRVLRFWNSDVFENMQAVAAAILSALQAAAAPK